MKKRENIKDGDSFPLARVVGIRQNAVRGDIVLYCFFFRFFSFFTCRCFFFPFGCVDVVGAVALTNVQISAFLQQNELSQDDILQMNVPKHNMTEKNTGVAYVLMKDDEAADKAISLKGTYIGDR